MQNYRFTISKEATRAVLQKKVVLINFAKFRGKHLRDSGKKRKKKKRETVRRCFPVNFAKFIRTHFLENTFGRLLLPF